MIATKTPHLQQMFEPPQKLSTPLFPHALTAKWLAGIDVISYILDRYQCLGSDVQSTSFLLGGHLKGYYIVASSTIVETLARA